MIFFSEHNQSEIFEEEEEEEDAGNIDDTLLGELEDDALADEELLEGVVDPLLITPDVVEDEEGEMDPLKEDEVKLFDGDDDDDAEDMEYDSFDDRDEM